MAANYTTTPKLTQNWTCCRR